MTPTRALGLLALACGILWIAQREREEWPWTKQRVHAWTEDHIPQLFPQRSDGTH